MHHDENRQPAFLLSISEDKFSSGFGPRLDISLHAITVDAHGDGSVRNPDLDGPLADLRVEGRVAPDMGNYGWDVAYHSPFHVNLHRVLAMAKLLKKVNAFQAKKRDQDGEPANFGQYVARVAQALGAEYILIEEPGYHRSSSYADNSYRWMSLGDGAEHINFRIRQWQREQEKVAVAS